MKHKKVGDNYILGKDFLIFLKIISLFLGLLTCSFSVPFILPAIKHNENWGASIISTLFFISLGMYLIIGGKTIKTLSATQYQLTENVASNHGKCTTFVSTELPIYICILPTRLYAKGAQFNLPVYLLSNRPIIYFLNYETYAIGLAKQAMDQGIVVLPVNEKTTNWIQKTIQITPPEYPKIAYYQK